MQASDEVVVHLVDHARMPAEGGVEIVEQAGAGHEGFARAALLGRAAVIAHGAGDAFGLKRILEGDGGKRRSCSEQVVAAAMARRASHRRLVLGEAGDLRQIGQGIELAEDPDDRAAGAPFGHESRGHAADIRRDAKALALQHSDLLSDRAVLFEGEFRHGPDAVAQGAVILGFGIDVAGYDIKAQAVVMHDGMTSRDGGNGATIPRIRADVKRGCSRLFPPPLSGVVPRDPDPMGM